MKIGIAQLNSSDNLQSNFDQIRKLMLAAQIEKPEIIFFPENSLYFRIDSSRPVQPVALGDERVSALQDLCRLTGISIHLTTAVSENGRIFNATLFVDSGGTISVVYRKMHLFDIELTGQIPIRESDSFAHGLHPAVTEYKNFKIGHTICYDVRFAELFSAYAKAEVDVIAVPAAFLVKTGRAHWEVLLRARAIESQCYIVAAAQSGVHISNVGGGQRETYGHSMLVNPWGEITAVKADGVGLLYAELSAELIQNVRKQIPMKNHRRIDF